MLLRYHAGLGQRTGSFPPGAEPRHRVHPPGTPAALLNPGRPVGRTAGSTRSCAPRPRPPRPAPPRAGAPASPPAERRCVACGLRRACAWACTEMRPPAQHFWCRLAWCVDSGWAYVNTYVRTAWTRGRQPAPPRRHPALGSGLGSTPARSAAQCACVRVRHSMHTRPAARRGALRRCRKICNMYVTTRPPSVPPTRCCCEARLTRRAGSGALAHVANSVAPRGRRRRSPRRYVGSAFAAGARAWSRCAP